MHANFRRRGAHCCLISTEIQATDILIQAEEMSKLKRRLNEIYVGHTGKTYEEIEAALERDKFMSPEEAKDFGA